MAGCATSTHRSRPPRRRAHEPGPRDCGTWPTRGRSVRRPCLTRGRFVEVIRLRFPFSRSRISRRRSTRLRLIKSAARARDDSQGDEARGLAMVEGMRSMRPGQYERELDAVGKFVLLAQRRPGRRVLLAHRKRPERVLAALQRRQAPDARRRLPAHGLRAGLRLLRERRHPHVPGQREVLPVATRALRLLPRLLPRDPQGARPRQDRRPGCISQAGAAMDPDPRRGEVLEAVAPQGRRGLRREVQEERRERVSLCSATGSAWPPTTSARTRDRSKPGMVFTIEPALAVPDKRSTFGSRT